MQEMNDALLLLASARNSPLPLPEDMSLNMAAHHQLLVDSERESLLKVCQSRLSAMRQGANIGLKQEYPPIVYSFAGYCLLREII